MDAFVYAWGPGGSMPWDTVYWKDLRLGMPSSIENLELPGGLRHSVVRSFERYRLSYEDTRAYGGPFGFDLRVEALKPPTYFGAKHFDQPMHLTGWVTIGGDRHEVDCFAMRDRSWYRRGDFTLFRSAYSYGIAAPEDSFLALYAADRDGDMLVDDLPLVGGHTVSADGQDVLRTGERRVVERDRHTGQPRAIEVDFAAADGSTRLARGRVRNAIALAANTSMLSWMSLVEWDVDGRVIVGEDQEIWSPSIWRAFRRSGWSADGADGGAR
ncbi:MAG TPA: hypothetical protein VJ870_03440 [Amycolatopsis sp.]|nr:hypothetical protein [Amycolatopsis sp.]